LVTWRNSTGRPLASDDWLAAHHRAKRRERHDFAKRLAQSKPDRVVDLGCATGLWLETLHATMPQTCEFIGLDSDPASLAIARERATCWKRKTAFELCDLDSEHAAIPDADLTLIFNMFSYLSDPTELLGYLADRANSGIVAIRQYDGAALRFGPMDTGSRKIIETSLYVSLAASQQFQYYDMDRAFSAINAAPFCHRSVEFELFARTSPFSADFLEYYEGTMNWTLQLISPDAAQLLREWQNGITTSIDGDRYFFEVDLVAMLS